MECPELVQRRLRELLYDGGSEMLREVSETFRGFSEKFQGI